MIPETEKWRAAVLWNIWGQGDAISSESYEKKQMDSGLGVIEDILIFQDDACWQTQHRVPVEVERPQVGKINIPEFTEKETQVLNLKLMKKPKTILRYQLRRTVFL